ncbi:hypothetical protein [Deinococcus sp. JMULE3]|uniref:hypothetical protein n=1 Tax=Deinococcus sp. JMULE3 TaxID=2518341 RepID=UPI00157508D6|nr:hypothetical protein [Deinococcus sp. JMULE3]
MTARTGVRWYRAYRAYGKAPAAVEEIARLVGRHRAQLADVVVSLRVERQAPRGEFLLFLTLETEQWGVVPDEIEDLLTGCRSLTQPLPEAFSLPDIQGMVSGEVQVRALGQCLAYRAVRREAFEDPFEVDARVLAVDAEIPAGAAERLLWFLSAAGSGSWGALRAACAALGVPDATLANRLTRHLRLLGHLEVHRGGRWTVTPPALLDVGGAWVRSGARDAATPGHRAAHPAAPDRLTVPAPGKGDVTLRAPGETLARALPDARTFAATLEELGSVNAALLDLRRFDGRAFTDARADRDGLYEWRVDGRAQYALRLGSTWRRAEFTTLRALAGHLGGWLDPWRYDPDTQALAVRFEGRLPEVYERALVLCSAQLPEHRGGWLVYAGVPLSVAARLASLFDVALDTRGPA